MLTPEQKAAYIQAQAVAAQIEMNMMLALNAERERGNFSPAYTDSDFYNLNTRYCINHIDIMKFYYAD